MSKLIVGILIGVFLAIPTTVVADYIVHSLPNVHTIYTIKQDEGTVSVFDDSGNKCYVTKQGVYGGTNTAISCVRMP